MIINSIRQLVKFDLMPVDLTPDSKLIMRVIKKYPLPYNLFLKSYKIMLKD